MNIIIVEDEPKIRQGIKNIIEKYTHHQIIGIANNGLEGYNCIKESECDLVITDIKMPELSGIEMLEQLREIKPVNAVILSGYSDFQYAQKAISLDVEEYILKPVDMGNFLQTLEDIENKLNKRTITRVSDEQLLWSILVTKENDEDLILELTERLKIDRNTFTEIYIFSPEFYTESVGNKIVDEVNKVFSIHQIENYHLFNIPRNEGILLLKSIGGNYEKVYQLVENTILKHLLQEISICVVYACNQGLNHISNKVKELLDIRQYQFLLGNRQIIKLRTINKMKLEEIEYPDYLHEQLKEVLKNKEIEKAVGIVKKFKAKVIYGTHEPNQIKENTIKFLLYLYRCLNEYYGVRDLPIEIQLQKIWDSLYREELDDVLEDVLSHAMENESMDINNDIILKVIAYIRVNYKKDIKLSDCAELVNITPEYLSGLFKKEIGVNFVNFLQDYRISVAKRILKRTELKITDISRECGFSDAKYFNKVFKRSVKMSPSNYRRENVL